MPNPVERCKYRHDWDWLTIPDVADDDNKPLIRCNRCGAKPSAKQWDEAEAIVHLRSVLKPGDTVYTVLRHVSRSGMSRNIDLYYIADGAPMWISAYVGHAIGSPQSEKNWRESKGLTVGGCGMDIGFHLVYNLSRVLFRNGFVCPGETCPSNHSNDPKCERKTFVGKMHTGDGGYALRHKWL